MLAMGKSTINDQFQVRKLLVYLAGYISFSHSKLLFVQLRHPRSPRSALGSWTTAEKSFGIPLAFFMIEVSRIIQPKGHSSIINYESNDY